MAATEGARSQKLRELFPTTLDKVFGACSVEAMQAALPTLSAPTVQHAHNSFVSNLRSRALQEFDVILREHNVVQRLNELDETLGAPAAAANASVPMPVTAVPEPAAIVRTLAMARKREEIARLQQQLDKVRADNRALVERLTPLRARRNTLLASLAHTQNGLAAAASAASKLSKEDVWLIIQTVDMEQLPQPAKKRTASDQASSSSSSNTSTTSSSNRVEIETGSSPNKRKRTASTGFV